MFKDVLYSRKLVFLLCGCFAGADEDNIPNHVAPNHVNFVKTGVWDTNTTKYFLYLLSLKHVLKPLKAWKAEDWKEISDKVGLREEELKKRKDYLYKIWNQKTRNQLPWEFMDSVTAVRTRQPLPLPTFGSPQALRDITNAQAEPGECESFHSTHCHNCMYKVDYS